MNKWSRRASELLSKCAHVRSRSARETEEDQERMQHAHWGEWAVLHLTWETYNLCPSQKPPKSRFAPYSGVLLRCFFSPSSCFVRAFAQTCAPNQNQSARWSYSRASSHWSLLVQDRCASVQAKGLRRNPGDARDALPGDWRRSRRDQMAPGAHARRRGTGANRSFSWNELFIAPWLLWIHCAGDHNCCLVRTNIQKATARGGDESSFRNSLCSWGLKCQQKPSTEVLFFSLCFSFCY